MDLLCSKFIYYNCIKKIILFITLIFCFVLRSQTRQDKLNLDNINYELLDSLIYEECLKQRKLNGLESFDRDYTCGLAATYQSNYMSFYNTFDHKNDNNFKGALLKKSNERFKFFYKKVKPKYEEFVTFEIISLIPNLDKKYTYPLTYEDYAEFIIGRFLESTTHSYVVLLEEKNENLKGNFKSVYNKTTKKMYVTGLFAVVNK